jgi:hypothetical protein
MCGFKVFSPFLFFTIAFHLTGCSSQFSEPYEEPDMVDFNITESGKVTSSSGVSSDQFFDGIAGYGWKCVGRREILEDGSLAKEDWTAQYKDGGGSSYFFDESTATRFFWVDAFFARCYSISDYRFEDSTLFMESNEWIRVLKLSGDQFSCITMLAWKFLGKDHSIPVYGYCIYKRMTDEELNECRSLYSIDYASLNK